MSSAGRSQRSLDLQDGIGAAQGGFPVLAGHEWASLAMSSALMSVRARNLRIGSLWHALAGAVLLPPGLHLQPAALPPVAAPARPGLA